MKFLLYRHPITGYFSPVVFDEQLTHKDVHQGCRKGLLLESAGFVGKVEENWSVYGESESLKRGISDKERDSLILTLFLNEGISGINLTNYLIYLELQNAQPEPQQAPTGSSKSLSRDKAREAPH